MPHQTTPLLPTRARPFFGPLIGAALLMSIGLAIVPPALAASASPALPHEGFDWRRIGIQSDNDEYAGINGNDHWYTSGVRLDVLGRGRHLPDQLSMSTGCPAMLSEATRGHGRGYVSVGQDIYTQNIRTQTEPNPNDRPVAGLLWLQAGRSLRQSTSRADLRLELGVTGPAALGEQTQDTIHSILGVAQVPLWQNQLRPRLGLNLHLGCLNQLRFASDPWRSSTVNLHYGLSLGNLLSQASAGIALAYGPDAQRLHLPRIARHVDPVREPVRQWVLATGISARAVFYDYLVDGDAYGYQSQVHSRRWQGEAFVSLAVAIGGHWQISYSIVRRTLDFDGPGVAAQGFKPQTVGLIAIEAPLY